ncbi:MAG: metallophosphoesterase [Clostridia bacterium]|nr:metallophosphoesterase [Clostridia bacterium]MBQ5440076.1 metallophosphoesterase [Clostridia bacterium]
MSLYVLGDPHLSFGVDKPMDIFSGWGNHTERIEKNWRSIVTDEDTVVLAGDISWGMSLKETLPDFRFIDALPGKKIILKGNHDYWWETKTKTDRFFAENGISTISILNNNAYRIGDIAVCGTRGWYYDDEKSASKVLNREAGRLKMSIEEGLKTGGEPVVFLHYPPVFDGKECPEMMNVLYEYNIKRCYYGHLHGKRISSHATTGYYNGIQFFLIACDYTQFNPLKVESGKAKVELL